MPHVDKNRVFSTFPGKMFFGILCLLLASEVSGLKCWTCENAKSNEDCRRNGELKTCELNQVYCQNEIRIIDGGGRLITKQCKQAQACTNNQIQNKAGFRRIQCEKGDHRSVCRCCCDTDNCNGPRFQCGRVEMCEKPANPQNGRIVCRGAIRFGKTCRVRCQPGFMPNKRTPLKCMRNSRLGGQGRFTGVENIKCIRKPPQCKPIEGNIQGGSAKCKNAPAHSRKAAKNFEGTVCEVSCRRNSFLSGPPSLSCHNGHWNSTIPMCVRGQCPIPPGHGNTMKTCTMGHHYGSTCTYSCMYGFRIVGNPTSTCLQSKENPALGYWTSPSPRCQKVKCPTLVGPPNGGVYCTDGNIDGSICTLYCDMGYEFKDTESPEIDSECKHQGNGIGKWTRPSQVCVPIMCEPIVKHVSHGYVVCSEDNKWGSSCTFKCDAGYDLAKTVANTERVICDTGKSGNGVGEWDKPLPACSPVICTSARRAPLNGYVICTNHNYAGSVCTFRCKRGFDLDRTTRRTYSNKCVDQRFGIAKGEWDEQPASCRRRIYCRERHGDPDNGKVECSNSNFVGSFCRFKCDEGFRLVGKEYLHCIELVEDGNDLAEWTDSPPKCRPRHCPRPWFDVALVAEVCSSIWGDSNTILDTKCQYSCKKDGYYAVRDDSRIVKSGSVTSKCLPSLTWSAKPPRCFIKTCPHLHTPQNGYEPVCSKDNKFGSSCEFGCKYGYKISHSEFLICINGGRGQKTGRWHMSPPTCDPVQM